MMTFLRDKLPNVFKDLAGELHRITYLQVLELHGKRTPDSPRVRNLLNVIALHPKVQKLEDTLAIVDTGPTVNMMVLRVDGIVPTLATSSNLFVMQIGEYLTAAQKGWLMGFDMTNLDLSHPGFTEGWWHTRMGLAVHVASIGSVILAALAGPIKKVIGT